MLKNYFNIALRNLTKHKFYSLLNILGLSVGLTCFLLIALFVQEELSYDTFHKDADLIYRVDFAATLNGSDHISSNAGAPTGPTIKQDYPEVTDAVRLNSSGNWFIRKKDDLQTFKEDQVIMADSNVFEFFTFPLVYGNPKTALNRPNMIAIDLTTSTKIFGDENPVGQVLVLDNQTDYEVGAVYEDLPSNSHFRPTVMLSMLSFDWVQNGHWLSTNFNTYIKLRPGASADELEAKFPDMVAKYCGPLIQQFLGMSLEEFSESGNAVGYSLMALTDIHLHSNKEDELAANGDVKYIYIFSAIAFFILLLACINFMNLSTARSANRAKEVGVRKVMGAYRKHLINQFLTEAILISLLSFTLAYAIAFSVLPLFNTLANKELVFGQLFQWQMVLTMLGIMLLVGLLAGSYPAFYLSAFKPAQVLKGKVRQGLKSGAIRSTLVVFQFSISIMMIIGTAIVFDQLSYIQNKKIGYNKDQIIIVEDTWLLRDQGEAFKNESARHAGVVTNTMSSFSPTGNWDNSDLYFKNPDLASDQSQVINKAFIDEDFIQTLGISLADGRNFSENYQADSLAVLINETAARQFGYENAVNDKIHTYWDEVDGEPVAAAFRIIGVVEDFHFQSMKNSITPLILHFSKQSRGRTMFKIEATSMEPALAHIRDTWDEFLPGQPFTYSFMDQEFQEMYESEQQIGDIFTVFAFLSIFIACLGLYGLASFTAEQRTKEIGIRKVLGASVASIVGLLSKEFIKLVITSFVVAAPVAYYFMGEWLTDFEYRTTLRPVTFIISGIIALAISWITMGSQSFLAARANPAQSLKDE